MRCRRAPSTPDPGRSIRLLERNEMNGSCPKLALDVVADDVAPSSVGVSLAGLAFGASDLIAWELERFQYILGEGPCADFAGGNGGIHVDDVDATELWPQLNEYLVGRAIGAVFSIPLRVNSHPPFGALTVYRHERGELTSEQRERLGLVANEMASTVA